jgi:hypothetical protein
MRVHHALCFIALLLLKLLRLGHVPLRDDSSAFLKRIDFGVISTISSSLINTMALSRVSGLAGDRSILSSFPAARMFESFFSLQGLHLYSLSLCARLYHGLHTPVHQEQ